MNVVVTCLFYFMLALGAALVTGVILGVVAFVASGTFKWLGTL